MQIKQTNRFKKAYSKLHLNQLVEVNEAINTVIENPDLPFEFIKGVLEAKSEIENGEVSKFEYRRGTSFDHS